MKKILWILFSFLGFGLLACLVFGFCSTPEVELLSRSVFKYKLFTGIELFSKALPPMIFGGFILSCSIYFGRNSEGSKQRFSQAMVKRYKVVMIISLICTFLLTFSSEVGTVTMKRGKENLRNQPKLVKEYIRVGNDMLNQEKAESAARYAQEALDMDPANKEAAELKNQAAILLNMYDTKASHILKESNLNFIFTDSDSDINTQNLSEVYALYKQAQDAYEKQDWFNAHFYSESAIAIASGKDPNLAQLKEISSTSWNNLSQMHDLTKTESQNIFNQKFTGYKALMEGDYLKSYYILKNMQIQYPELKNDPDLNFYTDVAEEKVNERTFFTDETLDLKSFESANDVYFSLKYDDGWTDIVYFKGVTQVKTAGGMIQYLRDLSIYSMDADGDFYRSVTVPYAKVLAVSIAEMNPLSKDNMGIARDIKYLPFILLRSVDRINEGVEVRPVYRYADSDISDGPDYTMLRMHFADFQMIENATINPELIPLTTLMKIIRKASYFGYSPEVYGQVFLNRILYPFFILIILVLLASLAWNNRLGATQYFKTSWILIFPVISAVCFFVFQVGNYIFKLLNYGILGVCGPAGALLWSFGFYVVTLFLVSLLFLSRKETE